MAIYVLNHDPLKCMIITTEYKDLHPHFSTSQPCDAYFKIIY